MVGDRPGSLASQVVAAPVSTTNRSSRSGGTNDQARRARRAMTRRSACSTSTCGCNATTVRRRVQASRTCSRSWSPEFRRYPRCVALSAPSFTAVPSDLPSVGQCHRTIIRAVGEMTVQGEPLRTAYATRGAHGMATSVQIDNAHGRSLEHTGSPAGTPYRARTAAKAAASEMRTLSSRIMCGRSCAECIRCISSSPCLHGR